MRAKGAAKGFVLIRGLSVVVIAVLLASVLTSAPHRAIAAPATPTRSVSQMKASDPDTSDLLTQVSPNSYEDGRIWTDKSVNKDQSTIKDLKGNTLKVVDTSQTTDFSVVLSALSQSHALTTVTSPSDVVFIIDISGSMVQQKLGAQTRAEVMVDALNGAIIQLMSANPYNRVAVVAYGGMRDTPGIGHPREVNVLPLGRYDIAGNCFSINGSTIRVNSQITSADHSVPASFVVTGGTPTQLGIVNGAKILTNNADTTFTDPATATTSVRTPNIILLTDGEPTFAWDDYTMASATEMNFDHGNGNPSDMGMDVLTVATASYWKKQVSEHYYGPGGKEANVFTIGVGITGTNAPAVIDPANNAKNDTFTYEGLTYNAKDVLDSFVSGSTPVTFPVVRSTPDGSLTLSSSPATIANDTPAAGYVTNYDYVNGYYPADDPGALSDAFTNIAQTIITSADTYPTDTQDADPNFTGNVVMKDVLGQGFVFKQPQGFFINDVEYNGNTLANDLVNNRGSSHWSSYVNVLVNRMGISAAEATGLIGSSIANGRLHYSSASNYSTEIRWYADRNLTYLSSYYDASGAVRSAPNGATCTVSLYSVEGQVDDPVSGKETDLMYLYFEVVTALDQGIFNAPQINNTVSFSLEAQQQAALWYIPASLIPQRSVKPVYANAKGSGPLSGVSLEEASPIRACYTVGLRNDFDLSQFSSAYMSAHKNAAGDGYYFYTNDWQSDLKLGPSSSTAAFVPNISNPYYYYTGSEGGSGKTWLYTKSGSGYTEALTYVAGTPYYVKDDYCDATAAPTYQASAYESVDASQVKISVDDNGRPYIAYGVSRVPNAPDLVNQKTSNPTATLPDSFQEYSALTGIVQQHLLGNNGRIEVLVTDVPVVKIWKGTPTEGVWIKLYNDRGDAIPSDVPADGDPLYLDASNSWKGTFTGLLRYSLEPDAQGDCPLILYSVREGSYENGVFSPWADYGGANQDFKISIEQPVWNDDAGSWSTARVTNTREPNTPPPPPLVTTPATGDPLTLILWTATLLGLLAVALAIGKYWHMTRVRARS